MRLLGAEYMTFREIAKSMSEQEGKEVTTWEVKFLYREGIRKIKLYLRRHPEEKSVLKELLDGEAHPYGRGACYVPVSKLNYFIGSGVEDACDNSTEPFPA